MLRTLEPKLAPRALVIGDDSTFPSMSDYLAHVHSDDVADHLVPPELGDLGEELRTHLHRLTEFLTDSDAGAVLRALVGQAQHDPAVATRLRTEYLVQQRERDRLLLDRAVQRGELPADTDVDTALDQLLGPLYYRVLVTGEPAPASFTEALVEHFLSSRR